MKVKVNKKKVGIILFLIIALFICCNALAAVLGAPNVFFAVRDLVNKDVEVNGKQELLVEDDKNDVANKVTLEAEDKEDADEKDNKNIVLYKGMEIKVDVGLQEISDMKITDDADKKYNTKYYNYENGKSKGETEGEFGNETYEGYSIVENVKKIAMTEKYDAIPRSYKELKELPEELNDMADYTEVKIHEIDLDGDEENEYIVCYKLDYEAGAIGDGEPVADSGIMLFDEDYKKVEDLVTLKDGFANGEKEEDKKVFITLDDVEYIDLDNDGKMEIVIDLPTYEGTKLSILKYSNDKLEGEKDYKANVSEVKIDSEKNENNIEKQEEESNNEIAVNSTENIVLFEGIEISVKTGVQDLSDMKVTDKANTKYNTKYYNYENGKSKGETEGEFGNETYEGYSIVENVKKIAMTEKYDAIPRSYKELKELPEELNDMADYTEVKIHEIDLDGDEENEYIVCYKLDYEAGAIGDGEPVADSGIMLFDEDYKKVADLVTLKDGFANGEKEEDKKIFITLDDVEYIDLDNDGKMEIVIDLPTYEGTKLSILKYSNDKLEGTTGLKPSLIP